MKDINRMQVQTRRMWSSGCKIALDRKISVTCRASRITRLSSCPSQSAKVYGLSLTCKRRHRSRLQHLRLAASFDGLDAGKNVESSKIDGVVRRKVEGAIEKLSLQVTAGDVASASGVSVFEADRALKAIAADSMAALKVSKEGELLYVFPKTFRSDLRNKSIKIKLEPVVDKIQKTLAYLTRVGFGTFLIASIVIVFSALLVIATSSSSNNNRSNDRNSRGSSMPFRLYFSPYDFYPFWDPYYYRNQQMRRRRGEEMNNLEAIFSFVFGDGNQNDDLEDRRWSIIGDVIRKSKGAVVAEQLLPYLDIDARDEDTFIVDESYMIPVLQKFDGRTQVDAQGNIIYLFPQLQKTAVLSKREFLSKESANVSYLQERKWVLSGASTGQKVAAVALGVLNVVGIIAFNSVTLQSGVSLSQLAQGYGGVVALAINLLPALKLYAASFFLIPALRWLANRSTNVKIENRNTQRLRAYKHLSTLDSSLRQKISSARKYAKSDYMSEKDVVFSSDQAATDEMVMDDFDKRLRGG